ncbi:hypothetical protein B0H16DRAFT_56151 [Mycena metata]|uniref:Uncharacterized protein n=1 Tax=Mycena metata TaxID=1033252 RepID=A0AAD7IDI7_9AGAR|nr:hypothetical protein B0H16DRAFT_56151 [Mycena metata]
MLAISPTGCAYPQPFICACGAQNTVAGRDRERDGVTLLGGENLPRTKCETQEPSTERSAPPTHRRRTGARHRHLHATGCVSLLAMRVHVIRIDALPVGQDDLLQKLARPRRPPAILSLSHPVLRGYLPLASCDSSCSDPSSAPPPPSLSVRSRAGRRTHPRGPHAPRASLPPASNALHVLGGVEIGRLTYMRARGSRKQTGYADPILARSRYIHTIIDELFKI